MKQKKSILVLAMTAAFIAAMLLPGLISAGSLEPSAAPGPTMKTLDQIPPTWSQKLSASERFVLVLDNEAVLDKETGLVWAKDTYVFPRTFGTWINSMKWCHLANIGGRRGWRLPTLEELNSLIDLTQSNPVLPSGHPFLNVHTDYPFWSSTLYESDSNSVWVVRMGDGQQWAEPKNTATVLYIWPVRGSN